MATLVHQCPHPDCLTERMNFDLQHVSWGPGKRTNSFRSYVHASCRACSQPVAFEVADESGFGRLGQDVGGYPVSLAQMGWHVIEIWPRPPRPQVPDHVPDAVAKAYLSAERTFAMKDMEESSAASYGRALDVGTKIYAADLADKNLYGRIRTLADQHRITAELADWAHAIRLIRNDALHEVDSITRDELVAIRGFTETVLTYLFTLPGMLKARQSDTSEKPGC